MPLISVVSLAILVLELFMTLLKAMTGTRCPNLAPSLFSSDNDDALDEFLIF